MKGLKSPAPLGQNLPYIILRVVINRMVGSTIFSSLPALAPTPSNTAEKTAIAMFDHSLS